MVHWYADILSPKMEQSRQLSICTFNCRSFKTCLPVIHGLCEQHDIVFLQEHWLLPNELGLLNNVHDKFQFYGLSAADISMDIVVGRPFGGTAVLYQKSLAHQICVIASDKSRITGIQLNTDFGSFLLLDVYMPNNYGDESSLEVYRDCLAKLYAVITDSNSLHTIILCSCTADTMIGNINVINEVVISDHKPVSFSVTCTPSAADSHIPRACHTSNFRVPLWNTCDHSIIAYYAVYLDKLLQQLHVPSMTTDSDKSSSVIEHFFRDVFACISKATADCIPSRQDSGRDFNVPGWNTYASEKHNAARWVYVSWLDVGKPRFLGIILIL